MTRTQSKFMIGVMLYAWDAHWCKRHRCYNAECGCCTVVGGPDSMPVHRLATTIIAAPVAAYFKLYDPYTRTHNTP